MNKNMSFSVSGQRIELTDAAMLVAGTVNEYTARFTFDADWDGYRRTAVFSCGDISREQLLTDDACTVPWEVLVSNGYLRVGVYGTKDGSRLPTIWTERRMYIHPGAGPTQEAADPSPTLAEQLLARMGDLSALKTEDKSSLVAAINEVWSSGGSGGASVTDAAINEGGHLIITLSTGKTIDAGYAVGPAGSDGQDGADGKSAYQYAKEGGYTGTEAEFAAKMAAEIPAVDTTLTQSGKAADAAAVGARLSSLSKDKLDNSGWNADKYLGTDADGKIVEKDAPEGGGATDAQVQTAVETWLDAHPEATTTVEDGSISEEKLADGAVSARKAGEELCQVLDAFGVVTKETITWNSNKIDANTGGIMSTTSTTDRTSDPILLKAGDSLTMIGTGLAYRYAYLGEDGNSYDATKSNASSWLKNTNTVFQYDGYYRIWISFNPTSTTVITDETLPELLAIFDLKVTPLAGFKSENIKDGSVSLTKLANDMNKGALEYGAVFRQSAVGSFKFSQGIDATAAGHYIRKNGTVLLGTQFRFINSSSPSVKSSYGYTNWFPYGEDETVSSASDFCVVGDEIWCFSSAADDNSNYGVCWRVKYDPAKNELLEPPRFFWHNWGHVNSINYNPNTDSLIMGNGSTDYDLANKIYIIRNVSAIKELEPGAVITLDEYGTVIDASGYDFGAKLNVVWANNLSIEYSYNTKTEYIPNIAYAYADDMNRFYILAMGYDTYQYPYGTYMEPADGVRWNGTYAVLAAYQLGNADETIGNPGSYSHCGQGGDALGSVFFTGLGHSDFWIREVSPENANTAAQRDKWVPGFDVKTGTVANRKIFGIAVTNEYLIVGYVNGIHFLPR